MDRVTRRITAPIPVQAGRQSREAGDDDHERLGTGTPMHRNRDGLSRSAKTSRTAAVAR